MIKELFNVKASRGIKLPMLGAALALSLCFASCESIYDNDDDCKTGVALRFVYDYHMEPGANAFPANVDCVDVYVFDTEGNYLDRHYVETDDRLASESYRMEFPLEPGTYHLVVYGGTTCTNPAFDFTGPEATNSRGAHKDNIRVVLPTQDNISRAKLHDIEARTGGLFYGTLDVTIKEDDRSLKYAEHTVNLIKDTNNIQIILQELSGEKKVDHNDYEFRIEDENAVLDGYNNKSTLSRADASVTYLPYGRENRIAGSVNPNSSYAEEDEEDLVQVACAELSTSRLLTQNLATSRLIVTSTTEKDLNGNPKEIINIPLIQYLLLVKGFGTSWIKTDQEFLDRQSNWNMLFFLQKGVWVRTSVSVNSWIVRVNNHEF